MKTNSVKFCLAALALTFGAIASAGVGSIGSATNSDDGAVPGIPLKSASCNKRVGLTNHGRNAEICRLSVQKNSKGTFDVVVRGHNEDDSSGKNVIGPVIAVKLGEVRHCLKESANSLIFACDTNPGGPSVTSTVSQTIMDNDDNTIFKQSSIRIDVASVDLKTSQLTQEQLDMLSSCGDVNAEVLSGSTTTDIYRYITEFDSNECTAP